ncbi:hypothetical protein BJD61_gp23 [Gordonia phage Obliviate]|uniref:Uncharacterized protein n=1 Tax=Gordonia phage Blino TaxID=2793696 RepID=A0A7T0Q4C7_9CAUD|nr:hypothetical protein BIZ75_gp24 [Gordonia phage CarolAnn]YP_009301766.1 hypothetical protein BJD61_gp23 [Gordonia phage Obliviate]YP_010114113.1 hypothetical protein KNV70_gp24 [Gordonia phage Blino]QTF82267.1 hypothetical protein SEA_ZIGGYZOO_23 [Gordonia phage ZiggyZoo]UVK58964.1 hypothetical protein SEA_KAPPAFARMDELTA_25 [Gordonia phage KappaFarmDelta]AMS03102.1 hypothetical protein SEA_OBLIVIATE_23 [Gordonia phage Obliviate]AOE44041.1 hypothetical protein SEA_CAROLANN_24 [Gordonia phag
MKWLCRKKRAREAALTEAAARAREQAGALVVEAQKTHARAIELSEKATEVDQQVRAEIRRNRWTDTLFGVIETGRQ